MAIYKRLQNIVTIAKQDPDTFFIPSKTERDNQKVGSSVRLHFIVENPTKNEPSAERMWVTVTQEQSLLKSYKGILESNPVCIENIKPGDEVIFKSKHIAQTIIKKDSPYWVDSFNKKAIVSKMCFEKGEIIRFMYRENSHGEEDSGWRMFSGHEADGYIDDDSNVEFVTVGYLLDKDPSLLKPLGGVVDEVYERRGENQPWVKVTDWEVPTD